MIYYLYLQFVVTYDEWAVGKLILTTADDVRRELFSVDFKSDVDSNLDALISALDANMLAPTDVNAYVVGQDFLYDLEKSIADNIELDSIMTLFSNLTIS